MKRKLQEIIQEKFNYEETCLLLPDMDLRFSAVENEVFEGTFLFHSSSAHVRQGNFTEPKSRFGFSIMRMLCLRGCLIREFL